MPAMLGLKEKGRLVCSALRWPLIINISQFFGTRNSERRSRWGYPIGPAHLCTIRYIVYDPVTKDHGRVGT
jgi:hypothetical protein